MGDARGELCERVELALRRLLRVAELHDARGRLAEPDRDGAGGRTSVDEERLPRGARFERELLRALERPRLPGTVAREGLEPLADRPPDRGLRGARRGGCLAKGLPGGALRVGPRSEGL